MAKARRTQPGSEQNPKSVRARQSGIYYGRVKPKGGKQLRKSLETRSLAVAREKLRDWPPSLKRWSSAPPTGTWGGVIGALELAPGPPGRDNLGTTSGPRRHRAPFPGFVGRFGQLCADELKAQPGSRTWAFPGPRASSPPCTSTTKTPTSSNTTSTARRGRPPEPKPPLITPTTSGWADASKTSRRCARLALPPTGACSRSSN